MLASPVCTVTLCGAHSEAATTRGIVAIVGCAVDLDGVRPVTPGHRTHRIIILLRPVRSGADGVGAA
jgi:hypothetical protein